MQEVKVITMTETDMQSMLNEHYRRIEHLVTRQANPEPKEETIPNILIKQKQAAIILEINERTFVKKHRPHLNQALEGSHPSFYLREVIELSNRLKK